MLPTTLVATVLVPIIGLAAAQTPVRITGLKRPVTHHNYLQHHRGNLWMAALGPSNTAEKFVIANGTILATGTYNYLNVETSVDTSYKPLRFARAAISKGWGIEGERITYDGNSNFIVCQTDVTFNQVFLQTGNDMPRMEGGRKCFPRHGLEVGSP